MAIKKDETLWTSGSNFYGEFGNGTNDSKNTFLDHNALISKNGFSVPYDKFFLFFLQK